jgi:hypothetical protein
VRLRVHSPEGTFDWESSAAHFRLGRGDACELRIEGKAAQFASWEHAGFSLGNDGANYVTDLGSSNGTYVDGVRISGTTAVRVGSIVQLGRAGPRLEVLALSSAAPLTEPPALASGPVDSATARPRAFSKSNGWQRRNVLVGAAIVLIAVVGVFVTRRAPPSPPPDDGNEKTAMGKHEHPDHENDPLQDKDDRPEQKPVPSAKDPETPPAPQPAPVPVAPPATPDPWKDAKERGMAAYRLIVVEDPKTQATWPLAGAVIVGERALLTTAGVGAELAKLVEEGFRMKAIRGSQDAGAVINRVRLHAAFQPAGAAEQLYFDMALLNTAESPGDPADIASPAELAALERGQPLACIAIDQAGEVIDRFQQLQPELHQAKVFTVTSLETGGPRLLHLRGSFSDNPSGSPIFNEQGHLVALYCEAAPAEAARGGQPIHYAKVIEPKLIELGLSGTETQIWVAPVAANPDPAKKESAK